MKVSDKRNCQNVLCKYGHKKYMCDIGVILFLKHFFHHVQEIKRKQSASLKASRRRQQILEAQKFEMEHQQKETQEKVSTVVMVILVSGHAFRRHLNGMTNYSANQVFLKI